MSVVRKATIRGGRSTRKEDNDGRQELPQGISAGLRSGS